MTKLNWSCTSCGMTSSRRFSVQRHIDNYNIHNGLGQVVHYAEYSMGIREGIYRPQAAPRFARTETPYLKKIEAEVENQIVMEIAKRIYNRLPGKEAFLNEIEKVVSNNLAKKNLDDILNGTNL